jgi:hypothetical protein
VLSSSASLRHCVTASLRHCVTASLRHCGSAALRLCGSAALRLCGLRAGMKLLMDFLQSRLIDVSIDLSRRDTGVTEHLLDLPQVGSAGE